METESVSQYDLYAQKSKELSDLLGSARVTVKYEEHQTLQHTYYSIEEVNLPLTEAPKLKEIKTGIDSKLIELESVSLDNLTGNQRDIVYHGYFAPQNIPSLREFLGIPRVSFGTVFKDAANPDKSRLIIDLNSQEDFSVVPLRQSQNYKYFVFLEQSGSGDALHVGKIFGRLSLEQVINAAQMGYKLRKRELSKKDIKSLTESSLKPVVTIFK